MKNGDWIDSKGNCNPQHKSNSYDTDEITKIGKGVNRRGVIIVARVRPARFARYHRYPRRTKESYETVDRGRSLNPKRILQKLFAVIT